MRFFGRSSSEISMFTFFCIGVATMIATIAAGSVMLAKLPSEKPKEEELAFLENLAHSLNCTLGAMKVDLSKISFNCNDTLNALKAVDAQEAYFKSMHNDVQQALGIVAVMLFIIPGCLLGSASGLVVYGMLRFLSRMMHHCNQDVESATPQPAIELEEMDTGRGNDANSSTETKAEKKSTEVEEEAVAIVIKEGDEEKLLEQDTLDDVRTGVGLNK